MKTTIQKAKENKAELDQGFWMGSHHLLNTLHQLRILVHEISQGIIHSKCHVKHVSNVEKFSIALVHEEDDSNSDVLGSRKQYSRQG